MVERVMLPERIDHQRRLVFLYWQRKIALLIHPRLPATAEIASGRIFVQQIALVADPILAEVEEGSSRVTIARVAQYIRYQRAIARPHIAVSITRECPDIEIGRGENRATVVNLGAHDEQAALVEIDQRLRQIAGVERFVIHPQPPVVARALDERLRAALDHQIVEPPRRLEFIV